MSHCLWTSLKSSLTHTKSLRIILVSHKCPLTRISNSMTKCQAKYRDHIVNLLLKYWKSQNNHALHILGLKGVTILLVPLTTRRKLWINYIRNTWRHIIKNEGSARMIYVIWSPSLFLILVLPQYMLSRLNIPL
jgi:hypothetical protein